MPVLLALISAINYVEVMIKRTTKIKTERRDSSLAERRFGVILEDINSKFNLVLEGHTALDVKIDKLDDKLNTKIDKLDDKVERYQEENRSSFGTIFDYLSHIDEELKSIHAELIDLKLRLSEKADLERLKNLEKRVLELEVVVKTRRAS